MANFSWLGGPPRAIATLNAHPILFVSLLLVIFSCIGLGVLAWVIHWRTSVNNGTYSPWWKNLKKAEAGKGRPGVMGAGRGGGNINAVNDKTATSYLTGVMGAKLREKDNG
ncbi:hypothetical protein CC78DRAFT_613833 [Lojkania enalia]|uniref:Uncharacterized protein n=1 Tax=Lojkania enalia TaxID=147567 RepID=A0A9P4KEI4_9PLEO|nr:hypothetical protein CC78DRAFT_613833 [Didymosphaeria enalia]